LTLSINRKWTNVTEDNLMMMIAMLYVLIESKGRQFI